MCSSPCGAVSETDPLVVDAVFDSLAESRRRYVLYHLRKHGDATLSRLADVVTGWVNAKTTDPLSDKDQLRIYTDLHHVDLPKLTAADLVTYDEAAERVELTELPDYVDRLLDAALEIDGRTDA